MLALIQCNNTARHLLRVFALQERLKALGSAQATPCQHVHVIGAGTMGGDIASWCVLQGLRVSLQDQTATALSAAMQRAHQLFSKKLKNKRAIKNAWDRLIPDCAGHGIQQADVVIEAIFEDLPAKQALFHQLETQAKPDAILATNTSSIPLELIQGVMRQPERLLGIHFFNPVAKMPLVEIVSNDKTDPKTQQRAIDFTRQIDKLPLPVKSQPGFLVNRVLLPYLLECMRMLQEGIPAHLIDKAATDFGMPMGPAELADTIGLDICLSVAEHLSHYVLITVPEPLKDKVAQGQLGRKSGRGIYAYRKQRPIKPRLKRQQWTQLPNIADRLINKLIEEAQLCLAEEIVKDADMVDAGLIFGAGFAPFRGGLLHYAQQIRTAT